jgi:ATP-dependent DNA ligase
MVPWRSSIPRKRSGLAPVSFIDPCLPMRVEKAPSAEGWVHEIKHDGFRLQIHARKSRVRLYTMTGVDWTERYPWIVEDASRIKGFAIIDAEGVIAGENGITDFDKLGQRVHDASAFAYAFDVMMIDGDDIRALPIEDRRAKLEKLMSRVKPGLRLSEQIEGDGPTIYAHACKLGLEGIVSKRVGSRYRSGKCRAWVKTKNPQAPATLRIVEGGL